MALGRPVNKDTQYKVKVHTLGKHRYVSTKVFTVGEDGKKRYSYKHFGDTRRGQQIPSWSKLLLCYDWRTQ